MRKLAVNSLREDQYSWNQRGAAVVPVAVGVFGLSDSAAEEAGLIERSKVDGKQVFRYRVCALDLRLARHGRATVG